MARTLLNGTGETVNANGSEMNLASGTAKAAASTTLGAGTWLVIAGVNFAANPNGTRRARISTNPDEIGATRLDTLSIAAAPAGRTMASVQDVWTVSGSTTVYCNLWHDCGAALACSAYIRAVRIF